MEDESNGGCAASQSNGYDEDKPKSDLETALANIDHSHLAASLAEINEKYVMKLMKFLDYFVAALSGVPCPWYDMFKESDSLFNVFHVPLSYIPEPVYNISADWIIKELPIHTLCGFVTWSFNYILDDMHKGPNGWKKSEDPIEPTKISKVAIFVALAMILRSNPRSLTMVLSDLNKDSKFQGKGIIPVRIWMIAQASQDDFRVGLHSWATNLLPVAGSNPPSRHLILKFVEKILLEPDPPTRLVNAPAWMELRLIPPASFEILMRLTFPAPSQNVEETERFEAIYPLLKKVALAGEPGSYAMKQVAQEMFTFCLRLAGEGNRDLAKEATSVAIWCLTENVACFKHWDKLYKENLKASVALLINLVEKWEDLSFKLSSSPKSEALKQVPEGIFTLCSRLAGEGNRYLAKEAASIAIWSLTKNDNCWQHWDNIYKQNLEASAFLLKNLVKKLKDHSLKLSSSPSDTLSGEPGSKAMNQVTQQIFNFSLRLAGEGNPVLPKQATAIAIWSLSEIVDCCKPWDSLYTKNLKASVALYEKVVDRLKKHSLKLSSSPPSDTLSGAPPGSKAMKQAMRQVTQQIFAFSLKLAQEVIIRNPGLAKEATSIAIWSLTENVDCWKRWANLYTKNLEASVTLLKKLVEERKYHSLKLSSSPSDTLTLTQTINIFRLKNQKSITEGGANASLYKEAEKSCTVILLGPPSRGTCRLQSAFIFSVVVVVAAESLQLFCFLTQRLQLS